MTPEPDAWSATVGLMQRPTPALVRELVAPAPRSGSTRLAGNSSEPRPSVARCVCVWPARRGGRRDAGRQARQALSAPSRAAQARLRGHPAGPGAAAGARLGERVHARRQRRQAPELRLQQAAVADHELLNRARGGRRDRPALLQRLLQHDHHLRVRAHGLAPEQQDDRAADLL